MVGFEAAATQNGFNTLVGEKHYYLENGKKHLDFYYCHIFSWSSRETR
jgi:hypothetical protein